VGAAPPGIGGAGLEAPQGGKAMRDHRMGLAIAAIPLIAQRARGRFDLDVESIVGYVLIGLVVGILARLLIPGRDPMGVIGTILVGIVGAVIGGWLAGNVFEETRGVDWIASIAVAIVLVLLVRAASGRRRYV
jgi:uncharacterized membrane protein YeaQ/YmgE (transglycosylase-associated protein family)